jgi:putative spermidine/putrescine transport system ATP-binding protein
MAEVELRRVVKSFSSFRAVDDVSLTIGEGEFVTLLGASGSGKTTCLRMVAGFVRPDEGQVLLGGADATQLPAHRRNAGMVFQQYALFPHLTVRENIGYGLRVRRFPRREVRQRADEMLRLVRLENLGERYPNQLSGGQRQRVALARAVAIRPSVLLLDEPLSALDLKLRGELQEEIRRVQKTLRTTTIFVTHDQGEALSLSDRVAVMRNGRILQIDTPVELYRRPKSAYVASFIGTTNIIEAVVRGPAGSPNLQTGRYRVALMSDAARQFEAIAADDAMSFAEGEKCYLCVRPESATVGPANVNAIPVEIRSLTYVGERWVADCVQQDGRSLVVNLSGWSEAPGPGTRIEVSWPADHAVLVRHGTD